MREKKKKEKREISERDGRERRDAASMHMLG